MTGTRAKAGTATDPDSREGGEGGAAAEWFKTLMLDRGQLARIRGEAIKVYLVLLELGGGRPGRIVTVSGAELSRRTWLSGPTVSECLVRLESLGLVAALETKPGRAKSYRVSDPRGGGPGSGAAPPDAGRERKQT